MATPAPVPLLRRVSASMKDYCQRVFNDYKAVAVDTVDDVKTKPLKAVVYGVLLSGLGYMYKTNPTEHELHNELAELRQRLSLLPNPIHNKEADRALYERTMLWNQNRLTYYNLWFFSLLVKSHEDKSYKAYIAQDKSLQDWMVRDFVKNIYDVGAVGKWWGLEGSLQDYDINEEEFGVSGGVSV